MFSQIQGGLSVSLRVPLPPPIKTPGTVRVSKLSMSSELAYSQKSPIGSSLGASVRRALSGGAVGKGRESETVTVMESVKEEG